MANMSYCAFENTAEDIQQLLNIMQGAAEDDMNLSEFIASRGSEYERRAVQRVLDLCEQLLVTAGDMEVMGPRADDDDEEE